MHQPHPAFARPHHASRRADVIHCDFVRKIRITDNNNLTQVTDAKAQTTQYTWGKGHQLISLKDAAGKTTTYLRNPLGQVTTTQNPDASYAYTYDKTHRLASVTDNRPAIARLAAAKTLTYSYSPGGLLNKTEDTDGNRTDYLYDNVGRLTGIWAPNLDYVSYTWDAGGRLTEKWFPNGINAQYGYNADNTLAQVKNRIGYSDYATVSNHTYSYDGIGDRKQIQDQAGQLTAPALNQAYTYDPVNNRVTQSDGTTTLYAIYDAANQLTELHSGSLAGPLTMAFIYDANGNLTSKCEGSGVTTTGISCGGTTLTNLTWDAQNRLVQVDKTGQSTQTYAYDDQGRRIRKTIGSTTTNYLYNGEDLYAEYTSWTAANALYTQGPSTDEPVIRQTAANAQYYHQDGLGSVVATTDSTGNITGTQLYDAWGNATQTTGTITQYGYTGREPDETGLIYYRARYYDSSIGRFISRDPAGLAGGINPYTYVNNNPINLTDPFGLSARSPSNNQVSTYWGMLADGSNPLYSSTVTDVRGGMGSFTPSGQALRSAPSQVEGVPNAFDVRANALQSPAFSPDDLLGSGALKLGVGLAVGATKLLGKDAASLAGGIVSGALEGGQGYQSFSALKRALGSAGEGNQWHHIVEQSNVDRFGAEAVHNTNNVVALPREIHQQISGYYSSKQAFTNGARVRDWLRNQPFEEQYQFGQDVMKRFGGQ